MRLRLLGEFCLEHADGRVIDLPGKKVRALLCLLALSRNQTLTRDFLATILWGDRFEDQARHSLRQAVLILRKALGDIEGEIIIAQGNGLSLAKQNFDIDALTFEEFLSDGSGDSVSHALSLYHSNLLEDFDTLTSELDDWFSLERSRLRVLAVNAYLSHGEALAAAGEDEAAIAALQNLLRIDPSNESAHQFAMRLHLKAGRHGAALAQFQACQDALKRHLDLEPATETRALFDLVRDGGQDLIVKSGSDAGQVAPPPTSQATGPWPPHRIAFTSLGVLALLVVGVSIGLSYSWWWTSLNDSRQVQAADVQRMQFPLPERPSIVILPFQTVIGDQTDERFAEAMAEGIGSALSVVSEMFVIAHKTAMTYRQSDIMAATIAEQLGVRYILEGSLQHRADKVRIRAQLIDALDGFVVWSETYDREKGDIFLLQDEIIRNIVTALQIELTEGETDRITLVHGTNNLSAWLKVGAALQHVRRLTRTDVKKARDLYADATVLDPNYSKAWAGLAWTYLLEATFGWSESNEGSFRTAAGYAKFAHELDPDRPLTQSLLGALEMMQGRHEQAVRLAERGTMLNPSGADVAAILAWILSYAGEEERSKALVRLAMRLSPYYAKWYEWVLGRSQRLSGDYDGAIATLNGSLNGLSNAVAPYVELAIAYAQNGMIAEARRTAATIRTLDPDFSTRVYLASPPYQDPNLTKSDLTHLRILGLPE